MFSLSLPVQLDVDLVYLDSSERKITSSYDEVSDEK